MKKQEEFLADDGEDVLFEIDWEDEKVRTRCGDYYYDYYISFEEIGRLSGRIAEGIREKNDREHEERKGGYMKSIDELLTEWHKTKNIGIASDICERLWQAGHGEDEDGE